MLRALNKLSAFSWSALPSSNRTVTPVTGPPPPGAGGGVPLTCHANAGGDDAVRSIAGSTVEKDWTSSSYTAVLPLNGANVSMPVSGHARIPVSEPVPRTRSALRRRLRRGSAANRRAIRRCSSRLVLHVMRERRAITDDERRAPAVRPEAVRQPAHLLVGIDAGAHQGVVLGRHQGQPRPCDVVSYVAQGKPNPNGSVAACATARRMPCGPPPIVSGSPVRAVKIGNFPNDGSRCY